MRQTRLQLSCYPNLSLAVRRKLENAGYDDVGLANAISEDLARLLNGDVSLASRLVFEARASIEESAWSLGSLDLDEWQIETLQSIGADSQGAAKSQLELVQLLGFKCKRVERLIAAIESNLAAGRVAMQAFQKKRKKPSHRISDQDRQKAKKR